MATKIYVGDTKTRFQVDVGEPLGGATTTDLKVLKPDGSIETWVGTVNGADDTLIDYTHTLAIAQHGQHLLQSFVVTPLWSGFGETTEFEVFKAFG